MATTGAMSGAFGKIEIRTPAGTGSFTDISGSSQSVEADSISRKKGEAYPLDSDHPLLVFGKTEGAEVTVNVIYTDVTSEAYQVALGTFGTVGGATIEIKWTPGGSTAGADSYTISGRITEIDYPSFDGSSGDPIMCNFVISGSTIVHAV
jgi:hypothetical protein